MRKRNRCIITILTTLVLTLTLLFNSNITYANTSNSIMNSIVKGLQNMFEKTSNTIVSSMNTALSIIVKVLIKISEILSIGLVIVGIFLWLSRISPYTGRKLIISAILLFIFAYILKHVPL